MTDNTPAHKPPAHKPPARKPPTHKPTTKNPGAKNPTTKSPGAKKGNILVRHPEMIDLIRLLKDAQYRVISVRRQIQRDLQGELLDTLGSAGDAATEINAALQLIDDLLATTGLTDLSHSLERIDDYVRRTDTDARRADRPTVTLTAKQKAALATLIHNRVSKPIVAKVRAGMLHYDRTHEHTHAGPKTPTRTTHTTHAGPKTPTRTTHAGPKTPTRTTRTTHAGPKTPTRTTRTTTTRTTTTRTTTRTTTPTRTTVRIRTSRTTTTTTPKGHGTTTTGPGGTVTTTTGPGHTGATTAIPKGSPGAAPKGPNAWKVLQKSGGVPPGLKRYGNGKIPTSLLTPVGSGQYLWKPAAAAYLRMRTAARAAGINLPLTSSYLPAKAGSPTSAWSTDSGWGRGIDVEGTRAQQWLAANAKRFGWYPQGSGAPGHITFGPAHIV